MWFSLAASPAPAHSALAPRPSFPVLNHQAPASPRPSLACFPWKALDPSHPGAGGLGQHHLLRLWYVSYWEESPEASWARVRWWFLPFQGAGTDKGQNSRPGWVPLWKSSFNAWAHIDLALLCTVLGARPHSLELPVLWPNLSALYCRDCYPLLDEHWHVLFGFKY